MKAILYVQKVGFLKKNHGLIYMICCKKFI